ncbi:MAG: UDP-glucose 4-epimerase [Caulobacteraceae bacterium]|nr:UDP-glucose 4-epimerase [Caulobacteraceae bacterium]
MQTSAEDEPHSPGQRADKGRGAVLVTGGAGYIGSHILKAVEESGRPAVAFDDLSHGFLEACAWGELVQGDVRDTAALISAIERHDAVAVIHMAGLIEVGRSTVRPDLFWDQNVQGTASVLAAMRATAARRLVFSSSAAVYGHDPRGRWSDLLTEESPKDPASPYGDTKLAAERMIAASCAAFGLSAIALRYFNAAGADSSGRLGEAHHPETHLIPLTIQAALGQRGPLTVFGNDFDTPDGTCLRDYIHVADLAGAHVAALDAALEPGEFDAVNVGTGRGRSVFEVIEAVERALDRPVPRTIGARRAGDPPSLVADPSRAAARLGWRPRSSSLDEIVASAARWHAEPLYGDEGSGTPARPSARRA